ncbi:hypothetical protein Ct61P_10668 [Colletotrichum tofieldiae]|nr:hypothetical protein Ct61P_10668 [Colletotrichum tofieldiae]
MNPSQLVLLIQVTPFPKSLQTRYQTASQNSQCRTRYTHSELALVAEKLGGSAANGQLARLLDFGLEDNLAAVLPHLRYQRLPGDNGAGEAHLDVLEGPKRSYTALPAMPKKQRPWRMGALKPPILAKAGSTWRGL